YHSVAAEIQNILEKQRGKRYAKKRTLSLEIPSNRMSDFGKEKRKSSVMDIVSVKEKKLSIWKRLFSKPLENNEIVNDEANKTLHLDSIENLLTKFQVDANVGLLDSQLQEKRKNENKNNIITVKQKSLFVSYLEELVGGFSIALWFGVILCFVSWGVLGGDKYDLVLGIVLIIVIFSSTTFSFIKQIQTQNLMKNFNEMIPINCKVLRNSEWIEVPSTDLYVGDIVQVDSGSNFPADLRIIEQKSARCEKSSLTGEPELINMTVEASDRNFYESTNMAFLGCLLAEGSVKGLVVQTGENTVMGRIAFIASKSAPKSSSFKTEVTRFVKIIGTLAIVTSVTLFLIWYFGIRPTRPNFLSLSIFLTCCVAVIVAFIPDGLPIAMIASLTIKLPSVESLGSTTVIASDKTGTLSMNKMTVNRFIVYENSGMKIIPTEDLKINIAESSNVSWLCRVGLLCTSSNLTTDGKISAANATEDAIIQAIQTKASYFEFSSLFPKIAEIPFSSRRKYHLSFHETKGNERVIFIKGALEILLSFAVYIEYSSERIELTDELKMAVLKDNEEFASQGQRIVAMAYREIESSENITPESGESEILKDLIFLGFTTIYDPPRPNVKEAITKCRKAGVRVFMVTGDHPSTAVSFAKSVGLMDHNSNVLSVSQIQERITSAESRFTTNSATHSAPWYKRPFTASVNPYDNRKLIKEGIVITGNDIALLEDSDWDNVLSYEQIVFARTTPQHKLEIVKQLQRRGERVTVTGDGLNDAPAMRQADVGIAMGIVGTQVSQDAADMILLSEDFLGIVKGIEIGRVVFENLKKVIIYLLPAGSFSEILPVLALVFLGLPLALSPFLMIVICVLTDVIGSLALVKEPPEINIMKRKPRNPNKENLVDIKMILIGYFQTSVHPFTAFIRL
ncbi:calcium ATPase, partial [Rozella allomycis CSF55]